MLPEKDKIEPTDAPNAAMALQFHAKRRWRGVGYPDRWADAERQRPAQVRSDT